MLVVFLQGLISDRRAGDVRLPPGVSRRRRAWEPYHSRFALSMNTPEQVAQVLAAAEVADLDPDLMRRVAAINGDLAT